jgi:hypothetical protein
MPTYRGTQSPRPKHESSESGNAWADTNKLTITANLTTADAVVLMEVPSGTRLTKMRYRSGDLDTGTTLTANIGYRSKHAQPNLAAAPTYFAAALTAFQAAVATWTDLVFEDIVFNEPVEIVLVPAANGTGISGQPNIWIQADGHVVGNV